MTDRLRAALLWTRSRPRTSWQPWLRSLSKPLRTRNSLRARPFLINDGSKWQPAP